MCPDNVSIVPNPPQPLHFLMLPLGWKHPQIIFEVAAKCVLAWVYQFSPSTHRFVTRSVQEPVCGSEGPQVCLSPSLSAGSERRHETALTLTRDGSSKHVAFRHALLQLAGSLMKTFLPVLLLPR